MSTGRPVPLELDHGRFVRHLFRALRLRCPLCRGGDLFVHWLRMRPVCPRCGLKTDRGEADAFIGGYTVNFVTAEVTAAALMLVTLLATWPDVPWRALMLGGVALMVLLPILFFPFSRTVWLAIDLSFRPPREEDFTVRPGPASTLDARSG